MGVFFGYVFLGLSLAAPIGPVNAAQLDKGIKSGFFQSWLVGLGAICADMIYMIAVYLGIIHFLEIPFMQAFLWSFGSFVLIYTGIEGMYHARKADIYDQRQEEVTSMKSFLSGFLISISNPLTILFWFGIYGSILVKTSSDYSTMYMMLYSCAIFLGLLLWDITMAGLASSFRKFLSERLLILTSLISGLTLIGFGIYFATQAFALLFL